jgi:FkbM family methyltransferase
MNPLRQRLEALLRAEVPPIPPLGQTGLVIYGAGNCGRAVAARADKRGLRVVAFLDAQAETLGSVAGIACFPPGGTEAKRLADCGLPVVVAIFNYATALPGIVALLQKTGFKRVVTYYEFHELFDCAPDFWLTRRSFYREHETPLLAAFDLFSDDFSRQVYSEIVEHRLTFDLAFLAAPDLENQYLPADLPPPNDGLRLIDGGAFTGDSVHLFLNRGIVFEALAAFEPDPENFKRLRSNLEEEVNRLGEVVVLPCGLGARTELRRFDAGGGAGSALKAIGETTVQVVAIDDILPNFAPTFIKLDIEGAEPQALRGAARTIARSQPTMAVCVYHAPEHLWEIPLLLRELLPSHRLAIRYHQFNGFDVVAYAFPKLD